MIRDNRRPTITEVRTHLADAKRWVSAAQNTAAGKWKSMTPEQRDYATKLAIMRIETARGALDEARLDLAGLQAFAQRERVVRGTR